MIFVGILSLLAGRFLVGAIILYIRNRYKKSYKIKKPDKIIVVYSLLTTVASLSLYLVGLSLTTAMHASIIALSLPFLVYLLSAIVLKEAVHKKVIFGGFLATIGLIYMILYSVEQSSSSSLAGDFILLSSEVFFAMGVIMARKILVSRKVSNPEQLAFYDYGIAGIFFLVLAVLIFFITGAASEISAMGIFWIFISATIGGIVPNVLYLKSARFLPAEKLVDSNFISPITGIIAAVIIAGDAITLSYLIGATIVFIGLAISNDKLHPRLPIINVDDFKNLEKIIIARSVEFQKVLIDDSEAKDLLRNKLK